MDNQRDYQPDSVSRIFTSVDWLPRSALTKSKYPFDAARCNTVLPRISRLLISCFVNLLALGSLLAALVVEEVACSPSLDSKAVAPATSFE